MSTENKIDYLTVDEPILGQNWVCLSLLTPELVKNCKVRGLKVRGVFASEEEAKARCEKLRQQDPSHNIYIAPVGHWVPWADDPSKAQDFEYAEKELNKLMKSHAENQEKAKMLHEQRKNDLIAKSISEVNAKKENPDNEEIPTGKVEVDPFTENDYKAMEKMDKLKEEENELNKDKNNLNSVKEDLEKIDISIKNEEVEVSELDDELVKAQKLYEKILQNNQNVDI